VTPPEGTTISPDAITPELALVDERLSERVRAALPRSDDTLARIELLVRAHRIVAARDPEGPAPPTETSGSVEARVSDAVPSPRVARRQPARARTAVVVGSSAAAALALALLGGVRIDLDGNPAVANSDSIGVPPTAAAPRAAPPGPTPTRPPTRAAKPGRTSGANNRGPTGSNAPRKFVWAPVPGASGYHVEFFRGSSLVFSADTRRPEVSVPTRWTLGGKRERLGPGQYQWYVWPVHGGIRSSQAEVQAKLLVPSR
jgi:hypothetical protein